MTFPLDLSQYRSTTAFKTKVRRTLWRTIESTVFRFSPSKAFGWRRFWLRIFGARLSSSSYVYPTSKIWDPKMLEMGIHSSIASHVDCYCIVPITIGNHCTISQGAFLCTGTHDISVYNMPLVTKPIVIRDGAWVCARAFVGPGVVIAEGCVVAACAVVVRDTEPWTVVGGNPAVYLKNREIGARQ